MNGLALVNRWDNLMCRYGLSAHKSKRFYVEIWNAYSENNRHYHTLQHLEEIFQELDTSGCHDEACQWATWYHDIIYNPTSLKNEQESSKFADIRLQDLGVPNAIRQRVVRMINETKSHSVVADEIDATFLDADKAILGASPTRYRAYIGKIAMEYKRIPKKIYAKKRIEIVSRWLDCDHLFLTESFRDRHENQARVNLQNELSQLIRFISPEMN